MSENERNEILIGAGLPSIFELIAQDNLSVSIQQAVRYIVKVQCLFLIKPRAKKKCLINVN